MKKPSAILKKNNSKLNILRYIGNGYFACEHSPKTLIDKLGGWIYVHIEELILPKKSKYKNIKL